MVKIMENPIKMDDLGVHYFRKHPYIFSWLNESFLLGKKKAASNLMRAEICASQA